MRFADRSPDDAGTSGRESLHRPTTQSFFEQARTHPDRPALLASSGEPTTYGELARLSRRISWSLAQLGLQPGHTVAVMMENRPEYMAVYAAAVESGLNFVGLNWHLTAGEVGFILTDSSTSALVASPAHAETALAAAELAGIPGLRRICLGDMQGFVPLAELVADQPDEPLPGREPGQALFYTSGTTGKPKGVRKTIRAVSSERVRLLSGIGVPEPDDTEAGSSPDEVHLVGGPLYHAAPLAAAARALDSGVPLVVMERWTPEGFLELTERHRVSHASMVPTMFNRLLALPDDVRLRGRVFAPVDHACGCALCRRDQAPHDRVGRPRPERGLLLDGRSRHVDHLRRVAPQTRKRRSPLVGRNGEDPGRRGS